MHSGSLQNLGLGTKVQLQFEHDYTGLLVVVYVLTPWSVKFLTCTLKTI